MWKACMHTNIWYCTEIFFSVSSKHSHRSTRKENLWVMSWLCVFVSLSLSNISLCVNFLCVWLFTLCDWLHAHNFFSDRLTLSQVIQPRSKMHFTWFLTRVKREKNDWKMTGLEPVRFFPRCFWTKLFTDFTHTGNLSSTLQILHSTLCVSNAERARQVKRMFVCDHAFNTQCTEYLKHCVLFSNTVFEKTLHVFRFSE